jgi:serine/threonine-protein kinase
MVDENTVPPLPGDGSTPQRSQPPAPATPVATTVTTGMVIAGTYEIEQLINRGGMGEVYRGKNIHTGDPVAMKIVLPHLAHDPMIEALFQKEAKVLGRLAHDAIVRYHTYMNPPEIGRPSLIMEFVEGTALGDRIKEGPMPEDQVRILLRRLASGLGRAHEAGVVHRDLSPDNIILAGGEVEHAKIIDFGIAKSSMKGDRTLLGGQFAGKFGFVAPEQLGAYDGNIDGRTDIYSLALLMVGASRGKTLKMGASIIEAVRSRSAVPDLSEVYPSLAPLFSHMLQPDPDHRPASMAVVIDLLDNPQNVPDSSAFAAEDDGDRTVIAAPMSADQIAKVQKTTAPSAGQPKSEFVGIPSEKSAPAPAEKKSGKGGLMAVLLLVLLAGGGAGAYYTGIFGLPPGAPDAPDQVAAVPPVEEAKPDDPATKEAEAAAEAERLAAEKAAADAAAVQAATDAQAAAEAEKLAAEKVAAEERDKAAKQNASPLDAIGRQLAWLAEYDAGPCAYVALKGTSGDKVQLEGFGTKVDPFATLLDKFTAEHSVEPDIGVRLISDTQCPVLDFMNNLKVNRGIVPTLNLDNATDVLKSGETVSGNIEGLAGRAVALFLINGAGGATNLKPWVSRSSDGSFSFSFTVNLAEGAEPTPQMILAVVTERPVDKLDAVPNGVTARALIPFMQSELEKERQKPIGALRFFRLEN